MLVLKKRIKGSTIIEVIMALMIGMIVLAMAMTIVVKTGKNYNAVHRTRALIWMRNRVYMMETNPVLREDTIQANGMLIYEKLANLEGKKDVLILYMKAMTPENRLLAEKWRLINLKPDANVQEE
ncbi:prepilin-type N-terminal cleavage/methylation domain-containing protein [Labilibaculum euxinus]